MIFKKVSQCTTTRSIQTKLPKFSRKGESQILTPSVPATNPRSGHQPQTKKNPSSASDGERPACLRGSPVGVWQTPLQLSQICSVQLLAHVHAYKTVRATTRYFLTKIKTFSEQSTAPPLHNTAPEGKPLIAQPLGAHNLGTVDRRRFSQVEKNGKKDYLLEKLASRPTIFLSSSP